MKVREHVKETAKRTNWLVGLLAAMPDLFVVLRMLIPIKPFQRFCLTVHHSPRGLAWAKRIHPALGRAWQYHYDQDTISHDFEYGEPEAFFLPDDYVLMFSGGLDSFIIWRLLGQPRAIYFAIGHKAQANEIAMIEAINRDFGGNIEIRHDLNLSQHELGTGYIPYRNLLFIMFASYLCPNVVIGQILEHAPDKNWWFYRKTERLLYQISGGHFQGNADRDRVRIFSPFAHCLKSDLVRRYIEKFGREAASDITTYTTSCYGDIPGRNCGKCGSCFSRYVAMHNNGLNEDSLYDQIPSGQSFYKRVTLRDLKPYLLLMYIRRWLEARHY